MLIKSDQPVEKAVRSRAAAMVALEGVSVRYRLPIERVPTFKEFAIRWFQRRLSYRDLWALREVSFEVEPGEILGVVGPNGAGKSTLLKVIARVLHPSQGRVVTRGSIAPILELGGGFHPELTGRENVYLFGSLLGRTRSEMDAGFEEVVDFAELWDFIDAPLRTYSSGMQARLAFAVATAEFADVILVDEVLAVGDLRFQEKCLHRMNGYSDQGATILFVSHNPGTIERMCERALWLSNGTVKDLGSSDRVINAYTSALA
ncbi:MAG: ABC transporter ATP-binding protein [Anaerolineales bacterium]|nr:ABC transporter ATP-binding protein [Anaerolineales bacterium]